MILKCNCESIIQFPCTCAVSAASPQCNQERDPEEHCPFTVLQPGNVFQAFTLHTRAASALMGLLCCPRRCRDLPPVSRAEGGQRGARVSPCAPGTRSLREPFRGTTRNLQTSTEILQFLHGEEMLIPSPADTALQLCQPYQPCAAGMR